MRLMNLGLSQKYYIVSEFIMRAKWWLKHTETDAESQYLESRVRGKLLHSATIDSECDFEGSNGFRSSALRLSGCVPDLSVQAKGKKKLTAACLQ